VISGLSVHQPARRLAIGVAASVAVHAAIVLGIAPPLAPARTAEPQVLTIELRRPAPTETAAAVVLDTDAEHRAPSATPANPVVSRARPRSGQPGPAPVRLEFPFDRYYKASELDVRAQPTNEVQLVYPKTAYEMRLKGRVVVNIFINEHGMIDALSVVNAVPVGIFEDHALAATRALTFTPAIKNGHAVKSQKLIEVTFNPYDSINVP
jgi:periplasmic protein TonB